MLVAPRRVIHLADRELRRVARDDAIDELHRVLAAHAILEQRRDVDERRRVADRVVLVLVMRLVRAHGVVAGPLAVIQTRGKRERAFMNGGADRHAQVSIRLVSEAIRHEHTPRAVRDRELGVSKSRR